MYKNTYNISGFDKPLGPSQLNENLFSVKEPMVIRTLPQYSNYNNLYYNDLLKDVNNGNTSPDSLIKIGKEYRILN